MFRALGPSQTAGEGRLEIMLDFQGVLIEFVCFPELPVGHSLKGHGIVPVPLSVSPIFKGIDKGLESVF